MADAQPDERFGASVAVQDDTVIIGSYNYLVGSFFGAVGAAYVFTRTGSDWTQRLRLFSDRPPANVHFGFSVALDGGTAVVGAFWDRSGSAYLFSV